jgi:hypothetical protein
MHALQPPHHLVRWIRGAFGHPLPHQPQAQRLDRIQGINIVRPFIARLFGAAKLEITRPQATRMLYPPTPQLGGSGCDLFWRILRRASGTAGAL